MPGMDLTTHAVMRHVSKYCHASMFSFFLCNFVVSIVCVCQNGGTQQATCCKVKEKHLNNQASYAKLQICRAYTYKLSYFFISYTTNIHIYIQSLILTMGARNYTHVKCVNNSSLSTINTHIHTFHLNHTRKNTHVSGTHIPKEAFMTGPGDMKSAG